MGNCKAPLRLWNRLHAVDRPRITSSLRFTSLGQPKKRKALERVSKPHWGEEVQSERRPSARRLSQPSAFSTLRLKEGSLRRTFLRVISRRFGPKKNQKRRMKGGNEARSIPWFTHLLYLYVEDLWDIYLKEENLPYIYLQGSVSLWGDLHYVPGSLGEAAHCQQGEHRQFLFFSCFCPVLLFLFLFFVDVGLCWFVWEGQVLLKCSSVFLGAVAIASCFVYFRHFLDTRCFFCVSCVLVRLDGWIAGLNIQIGWICWHRDAFGLWLCCFLRRVRMFAFFTVHLGRKEIEASRPCFVTPWAEVQIYGHPTSLRAAQLQDLHPGPFEDQGEWYVDVADKHWANSQSKIRSFVGDLEIQQTLPSRYVHMCVQHALSCVSFLLNIHNIN